MVSDYFIHVIRGECLIPCFGRIWSLRQMVDVPCSVHFEEGLILVLVGYGLWGVSHDNHRHCKQDVLILVLVGYGLWEQSDFYDILNHLNVLILVLVGYGLWASRSAVKSRLHKSLNPCFGGIWSLKGRASARHGASHQHRLNPCFGGIWSLRVIYCRGRLVSTRVLILVLVGYGLWVMIWKSKSSRKRRLNPCFGGIWSLREEVVLNFKEFVLWS